MGGPGASRVEIELVDRASELELLADDWARLLSSSRSDSFFLTWPWVRAWWNTYGDEYELKVLVARDADRSICGIAPLVVAPGSGRRLEFLGQNQAWGEYLDFFTRVGMEEVVVEQFSSTLLSLREAGVWSSLHFRFVRRDAGNLPLLLKAFAERGAELRQSREEASPFVELPTTWNDYLNGKGREFRWRVKNRARRLRRKGDTRLLHAGTDLPVAEAFDQFVALHNERWQVTMDPRFERFHRSLVEAIHPQGWLVLVLLTLADRPVAARYDFAYAGKVWCYQGGWSRELAVDGVASVLLAEVLEWAISRGFGEYDFLAGDVPYKRKWSTSARTTIDLELDGEGSPTRALRALNAERDQ